jgi:hypothetical protein
LSVLLTDGTYGVRRRAEPTLDAYRSPVPAAYGSLLGPWPGAAFEQAGGSWRLRLDVAAWPLRAGDAVEGQGRAWLVSWAELRKHAVNPVVDFVAAEGILRPPDSLTHEERA